jgi:ABC-type uncharacterized transport system substrate-binding protein
MLGEGLRRLWLGVFLIAGVSLALLLFDRGGRRGGPAADRKRVSMLAFISAVDSDECQRGMRNGLAEELREGVDYELIVRNAQGDMPTLSSLVDAALGDGSDLILTLSTPTLQAAVQRVKTTPIVFSFSSNPLGAGAGKTYEDHLANVTGIPTTAAYEEVLDLIREILPQARRLGTLVVPSEVNSVYNTERMRQLAEQHGFELISVAVNSSSEVSDAALALLAQPIDAVCQVPSNVTITGFASLALPAQRAHIPVFGFLSADAENGAIAVAARDYYESCHAAGKLAARVLRGADPATIPFYEVGSNELLINAKAARATGIALPASLVARADRVLE